MERTGLSYMVTAELGTDWTRHVDENSGRFARVVTLIQSDGESLLEFAARARSKAAELGRIAGATVLCTDTGTRQALAERITVLQSCVAAMRGVPGRELSLVVPGGHRGRLPHWAQTLLRGVEDRDPGMDLSVQCEQHIEAA
jgi:hypothetical protein